MHRVEAEGAGHEVRRRLGGAADAAHLHDALGLDTHLVEGLSNPLVGGIMPASGAQRGLAAAVIQDLESAVIRFDWLGCTWRGRHDYLLAPSWAAIWEVIERASMGSPLKCSTERSFTTRS